MKAIWRGQVIAESDRTLDVGGYRYFPRETVRINLLRMAPKTQSERVCPTYEAPRAGMRRSITGSFGRHGRTNEEDME